MFPISVILLTISCKVIKRFRNIVSSNTETRLYKAFIMPYFLYCSSVRHICGVRNKRKLELLNKQALHLISDDNNNTYKTLLNNLNMTTLQIKLCKYVCMYACVPGCMHACMDGLLRFKNMISHLVINQCMHACVG